MLNVESRNSLQERLPVGLVATRSWLQAQQLNPHFIDNAVKSGTLMPLVSGVYVRETTHITWKGAITSLQRMTNRPIHIGGLSALDLEGLAHYQSRGKANVVDIYSATPLPTWLNKLKLDTYFAWKGTRKIWPETLLHETKFLREENWREELPPLIYSGPEKAMLEALADIANTLSFEYADHLMQGLANLSPRKLDVLLRACSSIKVKRVFMWLAERHNHAWLKYLKPQEYDLGSGKRVIAVNGRLDKKWNITVPKEM